MPAGNAAAGSRLALILVSAALVLSALVRQLSVPGSGPIVPVVAANVGDAVPATWTIGAEEFYSDYRMAVVDQPVLPAPRAAPTG